MSFGRLERPRSAQPFSDINVTPLVDVMLVLVVILIITAPLLASQLRLTLPRVEADTPVSAGQGVRIALDDHAQLYLDDVPLGPQAARERLMDLGRRSPQTEVQLYADAAVPYGRVAEVLSWLQAAGLSKIGFAADPRAAPAVSPKP